MHTTCDELLIPPVPVDSVGANRESLSSIFRRTCEHNYLSVSDVTHGLMLPTSGPSLIRAKKLVKPIHLLNGGGQNSVRFIEKFYEFAKVPRLFEATLQEINQLVGVQCLYASRFRKWCPVCLSGDCETAHGPYERLIWNINCVDVCPVHCVMLESVCTSCKGTRFPILSGLDISGFCPKCLGWNGGARVSLDGLGDDYSRYLIWIAKSFENLLDQPLSSKHDAGRSLLKYCDAITDFHFGGVKAHFATALARNKSVVATWYSGNSLPAWNAICDISYVFQIPMRSLLTEELDALQFSQVCALPLASSQRSRSRRRTPRKWDDSSFLKFFAEVEAGHYPNLLSLDCVAMQLGIDSSQLRKRLPIECRELSAKLAIRRNGKQQRYVAAREIDIALAAKQIGEEIAGTYSSISRREVDRRVGSRGLSLRWGELPEVKRMILEAAQSAAPGNLPENS